jgi:predicted MFS family arabinose efflux permease
MLAMGVDIALARMGYGLVLPAIRADVPGTLAAFGIVAAVHSSGYLAGSLIAPLCMRVEPSARRTATIAQFVVAASLFVSAFAPSIGVLAASRFVLGVAVGVGVATAVVGSLERVTPDRRGAVSGAVWGGCGILLALSALATPWILGLHDRWRFATVIVAAVALLAGAGIWRAFSAPLVPGVVATGGDTPFHLRDLLRPHRYLLLGLAYVTFGLAYFAYGTFVVVALRSLGLAITEIAAVWAAYGVAGYVGAMAVGPLLSGRFRRWALALSLAAGALGSAITSVPSVVTAVLGAVCVGFGLCSTPAVTSALARARSSTATAAAAFVAVTTMMSLGQISGPVIAGFLADSSGPRAVLLVVAAVYGTGAILALIDGLLQGSDRNDAPHGSQVD